MIQNTPPTPGERLDFEYGFAKTMKVINSILILTILALGVLIYKNETKEVKEIPVISPTTPYEPLVPVMPSPTAKKSENVPERQPEPLKVRWSYLMP